MYRTNNGFVFNNLRDAVYMLIRDKINKPRSNTVAAVVRDIHTDTRVAYNSGSAIVYDFNQLQLIENLCVQRKVAKENHKIHKIRLSSI